MKFCDGLITTISDHAGCRNGMQALSLHFSPVHGHFEPADLQYRFRVVLRKLEPNYMINEINASLQHFALGDIEILVTRAPCTQHMTTTQRRLSYGEICFDLETSSTGCLSRLSYHWMVLPIKKAQLPQNVARLASYCAPELRRLRRSSKLRPTSPGHVAQVCTSSSESRS